MSGIIVLFWFVDGGSALRYFVRPQNFPLREIFTLKLLQDFIYGSHVLPLRIVGRYRYVIHTTKLSYYEGVGQCLMLTVFASWTDDTIARKVNGSDASSFAQVCGCCPSQGRRTIQYCLSDTLLTTC